jgi:hypothetical protein
VVKTMPNVPMPNVPKPIARTSENRIEKADLNVISDRGFLQQGTIVATKVT